MEKPRRNKKIIIRQEADEAFLFNPDSGDIKIINSTGIFIWELCDGKHSCSEIIKEMDEEFELETRTIASNDLGKFLSSLSGGGFIFYGREFNG